MTNEFIQILDNFRKNVATSVKNVDKIKLNDGWGRDHDDNLFQLMSTDQFVINKYLYEAISSTTNFKTMGNLFSR